jgi:hypothetical protein
MQDKRFMDSKAVHRVTLIFQDLDASTQSSRIRTGVNELMTRFVRVDPAAPPRRVRCPTCAVKAQWTPSAEQAYQRIKTWFLAHYENPIESCPFESAEGGYQYIWGGPYDALDVIARKWGPVFPASVLARIAQRLCDEEECDEWSGRPD